MADARLSHLCAYKYQRLATELLTPVKIPQLEQRKLTPKFCSSFAKSLSQSSVQATIQQVRDLGRIRAIDLLPDFVQIAGFVLPDFIPDSYTRLYQISDLISVSFKSCFALISLSLYGSTEYSALWVT
ncbi:hypothetical protein F511_39628 [Dorcoceras hygrometricum]|uniref:Uncharacterized protein n=1 Tax=Dorcoceras hygrometricum TaxID=472368 RepID=A0A2Z7BBJ2_9LAMI|nr:hypothetical protein F511_39628 [Dorcoceras hygrometricum]